MAWLQRFRIGNISPKETPVEVARPLEVTLVESSRPPLDPGTYQTIELEQYEIHKRCLAALRGLQVLELPGDRPRPKEPARLAAGVTAYAQALFESEAGRYPDDPRRNQWLADLAPRIEAMLMRRIWEMDTVSVPKLTFHATREKVDEMMREALEGCVREMTKATAEVAPQVSDEPHPQRKDMNLAPLAFTVQPPAGAFIPSTFPSTFPARPQPSGPAMGNQIRILRRESRLTIDELAAKIGIAARSVQRHEAGEVLEIRLRHLRTYERVFSSLLKRPVRL